MRKIAEREHRNSLEQLHRPPPIKHILQEMRAPTHLATYEPSLEPCSARHSSFHGEQRGRGREDELRGRVETRKENLASPMKSKHWNNTEQDGEETEAGEAWMYIRRVRVNRKNLVALTAAEVE